MSYGEKITTTGTVLSVTATQDGTWLVRLKVKTKVIIARAITEPDIGAHVSVEGRDPDFQIIRTRSRF